MSYSIRKSFGEDPMSCLPGLVASYASGSGQCVPTTEPMPEGTAPCWGRPHEYVNPDTQSCKCEAGYSRDIDTMECLSDEGMVSYPETPTSPASASVPTWALVLGAGAVGIFLLGVLSR